MGQLEMRFREAPSLSKNFHKIYPRKMLFYLQPKPI
jgi:hypothetical protein